MSSEEDQELSLVSIHVVCLGLQLHFDGFIMYILGAGQNALQARL